MSGYVLFCHGIVKSTETLDAKKRHNIRIVSIGTEGQLTMLCKSEVLLKFFLQFYGVTFLIELYNLLVFLGDNYLLFDPTKSTAKYRFQIKCLFLVNERELMLYPQNRIRAYGEDETILNIQLSNVPEETAMARFKISTEFLRPELLNSFQFPQKKQGKSIFIDPTTLTSQLVYNDKVNFDLLLLFQTSIHPELKEYYVDIRPNRTDPQFRNITFVQPMGIYKMLDVTSQMSFMKLIDSLSKHRSFSLSQVLDSIKSIEPTDNPIYLFLDPCKKFSSTVAFSSEPMERLVQSLGQILVTQGKGVGSVEEQGKRAITRMNSQFTARPLPPLGTRKKYQDELAKITQRRAGLQSKLAQMDHYLKLNHQWFLEAPLVSRGAISTEMTQIIAKKQQLQQELKIVINLQDQARKVIKQHGMQVGSLAEALAQLQQQDSAESSSDFTASSSTLA